MTAKDGRISVDECAKRLHLTPAKIAQAITDGQWWFLGAHRIGERTYVIPRAMFEAWLAGTLQIPKEANEELTALLRQDEAARAFWTAA